jgi:hypothetical protein
MDNEQMLKVQNHSTPQYRNCYKWIEQQLANAGEFGDVEIRKAMAIGIAQKCSEIEMTLEDYLLLRVEIRSSIDFG